MEVTYCCKDCGNKITSVSALYGKGRCRQCSNIGQNNGNYSKGKQIVPCDWCHKDILKWSCYVNKHNFCDHDCRGKWHSVEQINRYKDPNTHPNYKDGRTLKSYYCIDCGKQVSNYTNIRCLDCNVLFLTGENNGNFKGGRAICQCCSKVLSAYNGIYCRDCYKGENTQPWINGLSINVYPSKFNKKLKKQIRQRDKYICQHCGLNESEHHNQYDKNLTIHHIDYNKENCDKTNLITLCIKCNCHANQNRDYWFAYYTYIIENYIY